jgi:hypothetical protein
MAAQDELARLEAERDRLRSVIAYYNSPPYRWPSWGESRAPGWLVVLVLFVTLGIVALLIAGIFVGQVSALGIVVLLVALPLALFIVSRMPIFAYAFSLDSTLILIPDLVWRPIGEDEARQRLWEFEARIAKLKHGHAIRD